jgi:tRNA threonylcarbamoyladenosine biosynthesis protein TsaE
MAKNYNGMKHKIIFSIDELPAVVQELWNLKTQVSCYTLTGPLGAGKTTLVRELLHAAGVTGIVSSPTFTYVNIYRIPHGKTVYHFDLYRISSLNEFLAQGFDEYLYEPDSYAFIEWPEIIKPLLTHAVCNITIDYHGFDKRVLEYELIP